MDRTTLGDRMKNNVETVVRAIMELGRSEEAKKRRSGRQVRIGRTL